MELVGLIMALKPLCDDVPAHIDDIEMLIDRHRDLAETEVAVAYVSKRLDRQAVIKRLSDIDPAMRRSAIEIIARYFPLGKAALLLRPMVRDPNLNVQGAAKKATRALGFHQDTATSRTPWFAGEETGQIPWGPTGWSADASGWLMEKPIRPTQKENLKKYGLPPIASAASLAKKLGIAESDLKKLMRPGKESGSPYIEFEVSKRSGGIRKITAPRAALRRVQRTILDKILSLVPCHDAGHGFVPGRSTVTNATPHIGAALVIKMDLQDFFPTIHYRRVAGLFRQLGYKTEIASLLAGLTTYRPTLPDGSIAWPGRLPQGAPTSPAVANLACRKLDARLTRLAETSGAVYTRYADDLTFSFKDVPDRTGRFLWWVNTICAEEGFIENTKKRRIQRAKGRQLVTGIVVNETPAVPRSNRRRFRAILHNCRTHGIASQAKGRTDFEAYLKGYAAYIRMVQPALGAQLTDEVGQILAMDKEGAQ